MTFGYVLEKSYRFAIAENKSINLICDILAAEEIHVNNQMVVC